MTEFLKVFLAMPVAILLLVANATALTPSSQNAAASDTITPATSDNSPLFVAYPAENNSGPNASSPAPAAGGAAVPGTSTAFGVFVEDRGYSQDYANYLQESGEKNLKNRVDTALGQDSISGFALMYNWKSFAPETAEDVSDFSKYKYEPIDYALQAAKNKGKKISITLLEGIYSPQYVIKTCPTFTFTHTMATVGIRVAPWPWGKCYDEYLNRAIAALGKRYDGKPQIRYVSITGPTTVAGVETNWPMKHGTLSSNSGPTPKADEFLKRYVENWKRNIDLYIQAFPHTQLALGLNNQIFYDQVAPAEATAAVEEIRDYAISSYEQHTARADKKIVLRLLGLTCHNSKYFLGPNDGTNKNLTNYVRLVWDRKNRATIMYEGATYSNLGTSTSDYLDIFGNGYTWGASSLDVGYPDLQPYHDQISTIAGWYRGRPVTPYQPCSKP